MSFRKPVRPVVKPKPVPVPAPKPVPTPAPLPPAATSNLFQAAWPAAFLTPASTNRVALAGGLKAANFGVDVCYQILAKNTDPTRPVYVPYAWNLRAKGTTSQGLTINLPDSVVVPDANADNQPNNPTTVINEDTGKVTGLNCFARTQAGGSAYAYYNPSHPTTHGGSGLLGGEVTAAELAGVINHALAINVFGKTYLNKAGGGFVAPAVKADDGYATASDSNYYGATGALKMGSRLALPTTADAAKLGVTSKTGLALFAALKTYGAIIVDNSAWDCLYINATPDAEAALYAAKAEIAKLFAALQVVGA